MSNTTSLPFVIFLVLILSFISESPSRCLIRGKMGPVMDTMCVIAKSNGKNLPGDFILALNDEINGYNNYKDNKSVKGNLLDVMKSPMTRVRLLLAMTISFFCCVVYYDISLNVVNLGTNLHLNVFLNAVVEVSAFLLTAILIDWLDRKPLAIRNQWGPLCMGRFDEGVWSVEDDKDGLWGAGIFGMARTYNLLFVYAAKLFPIVVRNAALGSVTQAAQMGAIVVPVVVVLGERVPFMVFGVSAIVGGVFTFFLSETLNRSLYDTMTGLEEGEKE